MSEKKRLRLDENREPYAICPHCHKRIYSVILTDREYTTFEVGPDLDGLLISIPKGRDADLDFVPVFTCPECHEVLATSEEEAEALFYEPEPEQEHTDKVIP
jgi:uncharacterized protein YlaI